MPSFISTYSSFGGPSVVSTLPATSSANLPVVVGGSCGGAAGSESSTFRNLNKAFVVGPGYALVPYKLVSKITAGLFVDLADLLPDNVRAQEIDPKCFWRENCVICDTEVGEPISNNNIITFHVNVHPYHRKSSERKFYDYNKADWSRLNELFEHIPWHCAFLSNDVNEVWSAWTDLFFTAVDECISKKKKKKNRRSPWISAEIIKLVRKKKRLYKKAKIRNNDESWSTYKKASNLLKKKCNKAR